MRRQRKWRTPLNVALLLGIGLSSALLFGLASSTSLQQWAQQYESHDHPVLVGDLRALTVPGRPFHRTTVISICRSGATDVAVITAHPLPPDHDVRATYVGLLRTESLLYNDCLTALLHHSNAALAAMALQITRAEAWDRQLVSEGRADYFDVPLVLNRHN